MANPNVEAAYFWVQIGQNDTHKKYRVKGSDFPNVAKGPEMVWVQRGDDHYWTWYGQPNDLDNPDYSYRFNYFLEGFNEGLPGDQRNQPDGDGLINLSLYFGAPGPYPVNEWKNIRNRQNVIKDLDNKEFTLYKNPDLKEGDVCRITHEGSDFEAWYVVDTSSNNYVQFKTLYQKSEDDNRPRTDVKRTGRRPNPDGTQVLKFDFFAKENAKPYNRIADDDWVWAQGKDADNNWQHYKVSGKNFKELFFKEPELDPAVLSLTCDKAEIFAGQTFNICWEAQDGDSYVIRAGVNGTGYIVNETGCKEYRVYAPGTYTYILQVRDSDNRVVASDSIDVEVKPTPITISVDNSTQFCGTNIRFTWFIDGDKRPFQSQFHGFYSNALPFTNNVGPDGGKTVTVSTPGTYDYTYEAQDSNRNVMGSETLTINWVSPPTASISSNTTQAGEGETFRISWTASGGSSYKLYDSRDGIRYIVSANSSKDFTASSIKSTRSFTIEVYDSSGTKVKTDSVNVAQLGSGYKWVYAASVPLGGNGKWSHGDNKTKFHNRDVDNNDLRTWWNSFSSGTRKIKLGGTYQDFYFPSPSSVGDTAGKNTQFSTLNLTGGVGTEIIIFDKP